MFRSRFGSFFGSVFFFRVFQTVFRIDLKFFGGSFVLQTCRPNTFGYACTFYAPTSPPPTVSVSLSSRFSFQHCRRHVVSSKFLGKCLAPRALVSHNLPVWRLIGR